MRARLGCGMIEYKAWSGFCDLVNRDLKATFLRWWNRCESFPHVQFFEQIRRAALLKTLVTIILAWWLKGPNSCVQYISRLSIVILKTCHNSSWDSVCFKTLRIYSLLEAHFKRWWKWDVQFNFSSQITPRSLQLSTTQNGKGKTASKIFFEDSMLSFCLNLVANSLRQTKNVYYRIQR